MATTLPRPQEKVQLVSCRPGETPFNSKEDLLKVKGLGVSVVENVSPYLEFPTSQPAK